MGNIPDPPDPAAVARERLQWVLTQKLAIPRHGVVVEAVDELFAVAELLGRVRIGCRPDGRAFTIRHYLGTTAEVEWARAKSVTRMMCANIAVRAQTAGGACNFYGGISYVPHHVPDSPGFTAKWMNTMDEHWFELSYRGED